MSSKSVKLSFSIMVSVLASFLMLATLMSARSHLANAKPLTNHNQVRFRRLPPKEFSAPLGSSVTIECEASSSPPPTIHWLKDGKRIPQTPNQLDENLLDDGLTLLQPATAPIDNVNRIALSATRSRLFIDCADAQDEATYTCVAENALSRISASSKLNLVRPLLMVQGADSDLLVTGSGGSSGDGSAAADLQQDAAADGGSLSAMPQCLSQRNSRLAEPARIHMWTHNIIEIMRNNVVLYCRSNIKRQPAAATIEQTLSDLISSKLAKQQQQQTAAAADSSDQQQSSDSSRSSSKSSAPVSWSSPDFKPISHEQKDKFEILETGDLLIKDLRWEDMGNYVCTVSNELGSDTVSTFVYPASVNSPKSKRAAAAAAAALSRA